MVCPRCGKDGTVVVDSRTKEKDGEDLIIRTRMCCACDYRFRTREWYIPEDIVRQYRQRKKTLWAKVVRPKK